jgi:formylglycine-generating enzyme required for sulfatase activity
MAMVMPLGSNGCSEQFTVRSQLLIVVDTDAHLAREASQDTDISLDATIDTLFVEAIDRYDLAYERHTFRVFEPSLWPLSFGVMTQPGSDSVKLRIRAFQSRLAGGALQNPPPEITIDRLAFVPASTDGVQTAHIFLAMDCMGAPARLKEPAETCLDTDHRAADPELSADASHDVAATSQVGSWQGAHARPCEGTVDADQVCVPGGFAMLGDADSAGFAYETFLESFPLRPILISPFWLDRTEFTVGQLRALLSEGLTLDKLPHARDPNSVDGASCTWLGPDDASHDDLPLNCVTYPTVTRICEYLGRRLPSEAEWDFAARGRGQRRPFPWGDEPPQCCTASTGRNVPNKEVSIPGVCGSDIEPVGSHTAAPPACAQRDVSRDGVFDLAGSLLEATRDDMASYAHPCWQLAGILRDPVCEDEEITATIARGGFWTNALDRPQPMTRINYYSDRAMGFRCARSDAEP